MTIDTKKVNLYEQVYLSIKNSIIQGEFRPGEKLTEAKLSKVLNASRTPIRDALRKLEQEGLVTFYPSQGVEVSSLSAETITSLYECRAVLEGLATRKAIENMSGDNLDTLEESIILAKRYFEKKDLDKVVEKNTLFHDTIIQLSKNAPLIQMMDNIRTQILRYRIITSSIGFRPTFLEDHWNIYKAIKEGDSEKADTLMKQHILDDLSTILEGLELHTDR
ncbi:GntR family transcriptional regulator [Priestia megaterium]|uniref:GntR family transcriptional regulator n=1 Tax=Priestia megaterium TaxID=1404 RepID=UPI000D52367B|nr:GntR family transcriptional regulator [Priestia megaterium]PVE64474.1 hypothetical protein DC428_23555 [Priestia megaterium]PVE79860.1 hypothetical protein DC421_24065 [Priestia megaterium]PVE83767.1 hypothetical protein DC426_20170 [Priestia megaterium]PVE99555.1 hypothetical protein DC433_13080 [Priestia megaterium]